ENYRYCSLSIFHCQLSILHCQLTLIFTEENLPMNTTMHSLDYLVFLVYFVVVSTYGYIVYQKRKKQHNNPEEFFIAEGQLTWWAIGASLIASNISAEQFIGMGGSGFALGLGIASYEWMAAVTLIIVAVFFMPLYLKNKI